MACTFSLSSAYIVLYMFCAHFSSNLGYNFWLFWNLTFSVMWSDLWELYFTQRKYLICCHLERWLILSVASSGNSRHYWCHHYLLYLKSLLSTITEITSPEIVGCMLQFSRSQNTRLKNLATIFLEDYCTPEQVAEATKSESQQIIVGDIPLPQNWFCVGVENIFWVTSVYSFQ